MKVEGKKLKSESKHKKCIQNSLAYKARARNWTDNELEEFANVLADDENAFAVSLEKLALRKSANNKYSLK